MTFFILFFIVFGCCSLDPELGIQGVMQKVEQLKESDPNVHVLDQFSNPANPDAHFTGTGILSSLTYHVECFNKYKYKHNSILQAILLTFRT